MWTWVGSSIRARREVPVHVANRQLKEPKKNEDTRAKIKVAPHEDLQAVQAPYQVQYCILVSKARKLVSSHIARFVANGRERAGLQALSWPAQMQIAEIGKVEAAREAA